MIPWTNLNVALDELDSLRSQLREARIQARTARFHHLLRARMVGAEHGEHLANVIELSGGWTIVHWLKPERSITLYTSSAQMRQALNIGVDPENNRRASDGLVLSLVDVSERRATIKDTDLRNTRQALSLAEREILNALARGLSNAEIAHEVGKADSTIKNRLSMIFHKLGVSGRVEAALVARDLDLLALVET